MQILEDIIQNTKIGDEFEVVNNALRKVVKDNPKDLLTVEIGDTKDSSKVFPQVKICRWGNSKEDNEVNFSYRLKEAEKGVESITTKDNQAVWEKGNISAKMYELPIDETNPEGGFEFEVVLKERPKTNIIEFTLQTKGLEFFYQPELTKEEIEHGAIRPENVVGSYAVYYKDCPANYVGGKEYKAGKAGHIFRPKIIDSVGTEVWGELNIDIESGILSVVIPQDFLDKAVYPVRHAAGATFGYGTKGATGKVASYSSQGSVFTSPADMANPTSISVYCKGYGGGPPQQTFRIGIHTDASSPAYVPNSVSSAFTIPGGNLSDYTKTFTYTTAPTISASTAYWLLIDILDYTYVTFYYDTGSASQGLYSNTHVGTTLASHTHTTYKWSIYCTYSVAASAPTVTTQDCSNVASDSATGNGNITNTGGANCTRRGFCYKTGTSGDPTVTDSVVYDDGDYSTGAYTHAITGLSAGTDYRVRAYAINSAGTSYGATVQLTTASAGTTTPQTITGEARIQEVVNKIILGKGRVQEITQRTITGKASISEVTTTSKTIQGLTRITKTRSQTISGKSRITETTLQTVQGKGSVQEATLQTILGKSRLTKTVLQTIVGKGAILETTPRTVQGLSRVTKTVSETVQGVSRITKTTSETITGKASIIETSTTTQTITGEARIGKVTPQTIVGVSRIAKIVPKTVQGVARVAEIVSQTIVGKSRVAEIIPRTIPGKSSIQETASQSILGRTRIENTTLQTIQGVTRVAEIVPRAIVGKARITETSHQDIDGTSRITETTAQDILGKAKIAVNGAGSQTILGVASIQKTTLQTILGIGSILETADRTITGKAKILQSSTVAKAITGQASIEGTTSQSIQGVARIGEVTIRALYGKANVLVNSTVTHDIVGQTRVTETTQKDISGKASIVSTSTGKTIKVFINGTWSSYPLKVYENGTWQNVNKLKCYNGTQWVEL